MPSTPPGIIVLEVLAILIGVFGIIGGAILLTSSDLTLVVLSIYAVLVGILYLACGIGFYQARKWAWTLGLVVSALALIRNAIEAVQGQFLTAPPGIVFALIIVYYLMTPRVKTYFGITGSTPQTPT